MRLRWFAGLVVAWLATSFEIALGCSCAPPGDPITELGRKDAVFVAKVKAIHWVRDTVNARSYYRVVLKVEKSWKGTRRGAVVTITTSEHGGSCGYRFTDRQRYLIYASRNSKTGQLVTNICDRTRNYETAADDLRELNSWPG